MKPYEKNMKSRLGNYYHQSLSSFWDVGTVQSIDAVVMHPCVVKLIGQKSLDAIIIEDDQNFLLVELLQPKKNLYKVLMREKLSSIAFD